MIKKKIFCNDKGVVKCFKRLSFRLIDKPSLFTQFCIRLNRLEKTVQRQASRLKKRSILKISIRWFVSYIFTERSLPSFVHTTFPFLTVQGNFFHVSEMVFWCPLLSSLSTCAQQIEILENKTINLITRVLSLKSVIRFKISHECHVQPIQKALYTQQLGFKKTILHQFLGQTLRN